MNGIFKPIHPALLKAHTPQEAARLLIRAKGGAFVVTLNFELLARAVSCPDYAKVIASANARICDGSGGALWLQQQAKDYLAPRIPGIDLGFALLQECAAQNRAVFLLGGAEGVAARAAERLQKAISDLRIVGTAHGYFQAADLPALRGMIHQSGAELVIVCTGSPRQEEWILQNRSYLPSVRLFLPLGGSLDVWAGTVTRAPACFRRCGLEWLWRLIGQPSRAIRLGKATVRFLSPYSTNSYDLFQIE